MKPLPKRLVCFWVVLASLWLSGCKMISSPDERASYAHSLATEKGWEMRRIRAGMFELLAYAPPASKTDALTIYIEGDGFSWLNRSTPSVDPTPLNPVALRMALSHQTGVSVYLARPCQYANAENTDCAQRYWTDARFASEVVDATNRAISELKRQFGATQLSLVGYSGGGALSALVAARRTDVVQLITVAGNLDHQAWTRHHRVTPLTNSLNATDAGHLLTNLRQRHLIGEIDRTIPPELARQWPQSIRGQNNENLLILLNFDHSCCWDKEWPRLEREILLYP